MSYSQANEEDDNIRSKQMNDIGPGLKNTKFPKTKKIMNTKNRNSKIQSSKITNFFQPNHPGKFGLPAGILLGKENILLHQINSFGGGEAFAGGGGWGETQFRA